MKNISSSRSIMYFLLFILASSLSQNLFSQQSIDIDSIKTGKSYKIILFNDKEIIGKVISVDSNFVKIYSEKNVYRVKKDDIFLVSKSLLHSVHRFFAGINGGASFFTRDFYYNHSYYDDRKTGFTFGADFIAPLNESKAIRLELDYTKIKGRRSESYNFIYDYSDLNLYTIKTDFLLGEFSTASKFIYFFSLGAGVNIGKDNGYTETYTYQDTIRGYHSYEGQTKNSFLFGLGGSAGYKISRNISVMVDMQYNTNGFAGLFIFWTGGYFSLRGGLTYNF